MATIKSNGPRGRGAKVLCVSKWGLTVYAVQTQPPGLPLLSDRSTPLTQTRRDVCLQRMTSKQMIHWQENGDDSISS